MGEEGRDVKGKRKRMGRNWGGFRTSTLWKRATTDVHAVCQFLSEASVHSSGNEKAAIVIIIVCIMSEPMPHVSGGTVLGSRACQGMVEGSKIEGRSM